MISDISQQAIRSAMTQSVGDRGVSATGAPAQVRPGAERANNPAPGGGNPPLERAGAEQPEQLKELVSNLNEYAQNLNRDLEFSVDEQSGRTVIRVVNSETDELIRQIPPDEVLAVMHNLSSGNGALLNKKA